MKDNFSEKFQKFGKGFKGKGFYIALLLCVIAIGSVGYYTLKSSFDFSPDDLDLGSEINDSYNDLEKEAEDQITPADENVEGLEDLTATETTLDPEEQDEPEVIDPAKTEDENPATEDTKEKETPKESKKPASYIMPVNGDIITPFALEDLIYSNTMKDWRTHDGVDIKADLGTNILAATDGKVESITDDAMLGKTIVIAHSGAVKTVYSNVGAVGVKEGQKVSMGDKIGNVGDTAIAEYSDAAHLHFSVIDDGIYVDPMGYID